MNADDKDQADLVDLVIVGHCIISGHVKSERREHGSNEINTVVRLKLIRANLSNPSYQRSVLSTLPRIFAALCTTKLARAQSEIILNQESEVVWKIC